MKEVDDGVLHAPTSGLRDRMITMLFSIVNTQNYQIHQMEGYLADMGSPRGSQQCCGTQLPTLMDVPTLAAAPSLRDRAWPQMADGRAYGCDFEHTELSVHSFDLVECSLVVLCRLVHDTFSSSADAGNFRVVGPNNRPVGGSGDGGVSPALTLAPGQSIIFDQSEHSNWYSTASDLWATRIN